MTEREKKSLCVLFSPQQEIGSKSQMRAKRTFGALGLGFISVEDLFVCLPAQRAGLVVQAHICLRRSWQTRPETLGGIGGDACHTNYLVLQSPSLPAKQKWIPSLL